MEMDPMQGVNTVYLLGNLGRDPEIQRFSNGTTLARFSVATTRQWKTQDAAMQSETTWHRVKAWGPLADNIEKYLHKGSKVLVNGRIESSKFRDKEGVERTATDIVAREVHFLDQARDPVSHPALLAA
jgi:single-strand DNA-binding protein